MKPAQRLGTWKCLNMHDIEKQSNIEGMKGRSEEKLCCFEMHVSYYHTCLFSCIPYNDSAIDTARYVESAKLLKKQKKKAKNSTKQSFKDHAI